MVVPLSLNSSLSWLIWESFWQINSQSSSTFSLKNPRSLRSSVLDVISLYLFWRRVQLVDNTQIFCLRFCMMCQFLLISQNFSQFQARFAQFLITASISLNYWLMILSIQGIELDYWSYTSQLWNMDHFPGVSKLGATNTGNEGMYPNSSSCFLKLQQIWVMITCTKESVGEFMSFHTRYFLYIIDLPNCTKNPSLRFMILKKKSKTVSWVTFSFSSLSFESNSLAILSQLSFYFFPLLKKLSAIFNNYWNYFFSVSQKRFRYRLNQFVLWDSYLAWSAWKKVLMQFCCPFNSPSILIDV